MTFLIVLLVLAGGFIVLLSAVGGEYGLRRILHFQRRRLKKTGGVPSILSLMTESSQKKLQVPLTDVRDLVISLQLGTSMEATLSNSLSRAAEQFAGRGALGERLQRHVEARLNTMSPQAVLQGLVDDFDCPQLAEVLERIRMAEDGGVSYNQVLRVSVDAIEEDIRAEIEQEIQKAPMRLTIPMVIGVFLPALVLGLIPLVGSALSQMQGR